MTKMLAAHGDQNDDYEIAINGFQARKINEVGNYFLVTSYGKASSVFSPKIGIYCVLSCYL